LCFADTSIYIRLI
jgi:hypothetical protein